MMHMIQELFGQTLRERIASLTKRLEDDQGRFEQGSTLAGWTAGIQFERWFDGFSDGAAKNPPQIDRQRVGLDRLEREVLIAMIQGRSNPARQQSESVRYPVSPRLLTSIARHHRAKCTAAPT